MVDEARKVLTLIEKTDQPHETNPQGKSATSTILPVLGASGDALAAYCPNLEQWPTSWMYEARNLLPGQQMVECFKPFLRHLLRSKLSGRTLRKHRNNLWLLGGKIIANPHESPRLRKRPMEQVVFAALSDEGGPLISHGPFDEQEQRSFDSTCRPQVPI
jgi:hypothetical protein